MAIRAAFSLAPSLLGTTSPAASGELGARFGHGARPQVFLFFLLDQGVLFLLLRLAFARGGFLAGLGFAAGSAAFTFAAAPLSASRAFK